MINTSSLAQRIRDELDQPDPQQSLDARGWLRDLLDAMTPGDPARVAVLAAIGRTEAFDRAHRMPFMSYLGEKIINLDAADLDALRAALDAVAENVTVVGIEVDDDAQAVRVDGQEIRVGGIDAWADFSRLWKNRRSRSPLEIDPSAVRELRRLFRKRGCEDRLKIVNLRNRGYFLDL